MSAQTSSTNSEEISSDEGSINRCNFYGSEIEELSELSVNDGPRSYRFEPCKIRRNVQEESSETQDENDGSERNRVGNTAQTGNCN